MVHEDDREGGVHSGSSLYKPHTNGTKQNIF